MLNKGSCRELRLPASFALLALAALVAACTTLSEPEQPSDPAVLTENVEAKPDPEAEYEKAKQECADEGGEWMTYLHGDGADFWLDSMRCQSIGLPIEERQWEDPGLLPYDVNVSYAGESGEIIRFRRIDPDHWEHLYREQDDTDEEE